MTYKSACEITSKETIVFNNQNPSLQNQVLGNIDTNIIYMMHMKAGNHIID